LILLKLKSTSEFFLYRNRASIAYCRNGDTLVVWKLDRMGRSMSHLIEMIQKLEKRGVGFQSLTEQIDTTTAGGRLIFHLFGALAEFERDLIRERAQAGLKSAQGTWTQRWEAPSI
jgi:DNA invertase Pin-like site-specific DNA recombinase